MRVSTVHEKKFSSFLKYVSFPAAMESIIHKSLLWAINSFKKFLWASYINQKMLPTFLSFACALHQNTCSNWRKVKEYNTITTHAKQPSNLISLEHHFNLISRRDVLSLMTLQGVSPGRFEGLPNGFQMVLFVERIPPMGHILSLRAHFGSTGEEMTFFSSQVDPKSVAQAMYSKI